MIGQTISHYKILEKLGEGGMGVVYKAQDTKLDRFVALKFLPPQMGGDDEEKQRFIQEAKAASALDHTNICTVYEINETPGDSGQGQLFIAMAYYEGQTLDAVLGPTASRAPLSVEDALNYARQICEGLSKAHEKEIVHRDLKPANVMITKDGVVKILDFGLAKLGGHSKLTKAGTTLGTTAYMSPEQARGEDVDRRTDIFSLGVLLYEMLTGRRPFEGDYEQAVIYSIMNEDPEPITGLRTGIPIELEGMVNKCLRKEPSARYQHVDDLLVDLKAVQESEKSGVSKVQPQSLQKVSNLRKVVVPAILSLVAIVAIVGYLFFGREPEITERVPIAVVDFVNETNEPELNGLSGMLITALEQSRRLAVMSRARMFDELKKMGKPDVTFVDEATGREIAGRTQVRALAVATIRKLGQLYTIDFKVMDPVSGEHLFTAREEGEGQESILGMIDRLSKKTRVDLREQPQTVQLSSRGVADVTTTNLEAYQHYFLGEQLMSRLDYRPAREQYRKAIALDSTFGLAYYRLANALTWGFSEDMAKEPLAKAFELIDRIPDKERYLLRAVAANVEKGWAAAIPVAKEMERYYPDDKEMLYFIGDWSYHARQYPTAVDYFEKVLAIDPTHEQTLYHLATAYARTNQHVKFESAIDRLAQVNPGAALEERGTHHSRQAEYEKAIEYYTKALEADSTWWNSFHMKAIAYRRMGRYTESLESAEEWLARNPVPLAYWNVADTYVSMGDLDAAGRTLESGLKRFPDSWLLVLRGLISGWRGDYDLAEAQLREAIAPDQQAIVRGIGFEQLGLFYLYQGKYSAMNEMFDERVKLALTDQDNNTAAEHIAQKTRLTYGGWRDSGRVHRELEEATRLTNVTNELYFSNLAEVYSAMGEFEAADKASARVTNRIQQMRIESRALMQKGKWDEAISINRTLINKWESKAQTLFGYSTAVCYSEKGDLDKAIEEVKKAASFYGWGHSYVYPHSFLLLGKIYEKKSDKQHAIENYEKFLDLWKDADPDLPDLIDAKRRLARLTGMTRKNDL